MNHMANHDNKREESNIMDEYKRFLMHMRLAKIHLEQACEIKKKYEENKNIKKQAVVIDIGIRQTKGR